MLVFGIQTAEPSLKLRTFPNCAMRYQKFEALHQRHFLATVVLPRIKTDTDNDQLKFRKIIILIDVALRLTRLRRGSCDFINK